MYENFKDVCIENLNYYFISIQIDVDASFCPFLCSFVLINVSVVFLSIY
jgi:hypothetical protein